MEKLRAQTGNDWQRDAEGRIIEWGVVRLPDRVIVDVCATRAEAEAAIARHYAWKAERKEAAERNRAELDSDDLPDSNYDWMYWAGLLATSPPIRDMGWELRTRTVTNWTSADPVE